ncbi:lipid-A-disaccharide synthase [Amaricoccus tamworthensis]|uniref:lipid-A-disaccharide synthase n=1 Tax=Amaricoccus tamworthensis TaxID=57002 RepID=UPI003C7BBAE8
MTEQKPRLFMIAGEASGDLLGAALIRGFRELNGVAPELEGIGGINMAEQGLASLFPMEELSVMGIVEVLPRAGHLLRRVREAADAVVAMKPDALVTIDSPDFCLRVAARARRELPDLRVVHYVAPSVWAWRPGRAKKMAKVVDHVLALLPFEPPYMTAAGMSCDFVGHPITTVPAAGEEEIRKLRAEFGIAPERRVVVVLPGSRASEITRLAPVFAGVVSDLSREHPDVDVIIPAAPAVAHLLQDYFPPLETGGPHILTGEGRTASEVELRKRAAFETADLALAASGTVSLELAAAGTPMVVAYKANALTAMLLRRFLLIDTVTLVNLVSETKAVPEFLQEDCVLTKIEPEVERLLSDPDHAREQIEAAEKVMKLLGRGGETPGLRAAKSVQAFLERTAG